MNEDRGPVGMPPNWFVAFYNDDQRYWWSWMCRDGFRHVAAFGYCAARDVWLSYDVTMTRTIVQALTRDELIAGIAALPANRTIVAFQPKAEPSEPANRLGFWCTPAVAHLVGVPSRALRPEALYRDLLAHGARPAFTGEQSDEEAEGRPSP